MRGCDATISTAIGYANRRPDDLKSLTDTQGIRNLADAALEAGVGRLVYCSVLTCDRARDVPHFWNKKLAEDYFEESGVPFVAIRPGAFLDQGDRDFWARGLRRGKLTFPGDPSVPLTFVHTDDVSRCLVDSLDIAPTHGALRVDIGCDRPVSIVDLAGIMTMVLGRPIAPHALPWFLVGAALRVGGLFDPWKRDLRAMLDYIRRGEYIADTTLQSSVFGPPPTIESATRRYLRDVGMLTDVNSNASDDSREVHA